MFEVIQEVHELIGSPADIEALAEKAHARLLVCSDSHGNFKILEKIISQYGKDCDGFIFCGDGAGDVAHILNEANVNPDFALCVPKVIACVRGNGDPASYPLTLEKSISIPNRQTVKVNGRNIMVVHGHQEWVGFGMNNFGLEMQLENCSVGFYGHTHIAREENLGEYKFVNPGSCSRPRGGQPACFAIATVEKTFVDISYIQIGRADSTGNPFSRWNPIY